MSLYLLLNRIQVQNANAIAGFTWGFPAITHFLGFTHNLSRKLAISDFSDLSIQGCSVISHEQQVHTYGDYNDRFLQSKNPAFLENDVTKVASGGAPSIVEEGKMNMTVSLVISLEGLVGRRADEFVVWLKKQCYRQRLAGGSILSIADISLHDAENKQSFFKLKRKLLPGFVLMDRSQALKKHYEECKEKDSDAELLDAWLDFAALKQQARPKSDLITKHLKKIAKPVEPTSYSNLYDAWAEHVQVPYCGNIPEALKGYFSQVVPSKANKSLLEQWAEYINPSEKSSADWEYLPKPESGYLIPIMTGYKAISQVYESHEIENTRDHTTPVCFVESVHSVGEWLGTNRLRDPDDMMNSLWDYQFEEGWYLCQQKTQLVFSGKSELDSQIQTIFENPDDELN